jgi:hypothetical protein
LGSDSKKPPRPRHRFSFSSQNNQAGSSPIPPTAKVTKDDILNSLTKYSHPEEGPAEEEVLEAGVGNQASAANRVRRRGSARGALVIFLGGFLAVWMYGYVTGAYEIPYLRGVTESPEAQVGIQLASSNPVLFGAISASLLLGVLYLRHRKKT